MILLFFLHFHHVGFLTFLSLYAHRNNCNWFLKESLTLQSSNILQVHCSPHQNVNDSLPPPPPPTGIYCVSWPALNSLSGSDSQVFNGILLDRNREILQFMQNHTYPQRIECILEKKNHKDVGI